MSRKLRRVIKNVKDWKTVDPIIFDTYVPNKNLSRRERKKDLDYVYDGSSEDNNDEEYHEIDIVKIRKKGEKRKKVKKRKKRKERRREKREKKKKEEKRKRRKRKRKIEREAKRGTETSGSRGEGGYLRKRRKVKYYGK